MSGTGLSATESMLHARLASLEQAIRDGIAASGQRQSEIAGQMGKLASAQEALTNLLARHVEDDRVAFTRIGDRFHDTADGVAHLDGKLNIMNASLQAQAAVSGFKKWLIVIVITAIGALGGVVGAAVDWLKRG